MTKLPEDLECQAVAFILGLMSHEGARDLEPSGTWWECSIHCIFRPMCCVSDPSVEAGQATTWAPDYVTRSTCVFLYRLHPSVSSQVRTILGIKFWG